jgi:hypothetical protein
LADQKLNPGTTASMGTNRNLASVITDTDAQSMMTGSMAGGMIAQLEQSILQGTIQGSAAVGDK